MSMIPSNYTRLCSGAYDITGNVTTKVACKYPGCNMATAVSEPVPFKCYFYAPLSSSKQCTFPNQQRSQISLGFTLEDDGNGNFVLDLSKVSRALLEAYCSTTATKKTCTCPFPPPQPPPAANTLTATVPSSRSVPSLVIGQTHNPVVAAPSSHGSSVPPAAPAFFDVQSLLGSGAAGTKSYGPVSTGGATPRILQ